MDFVEINKEKFRKLYEETDLSNKEIALKLGCSESIVNQRANKWGFKKFKKYDFLTEELLKELYCKQGMSMKQIADKYNTTKRTVQRYIESYGLKSCVPKNKYDIKEKDLRNYVEQGMSMINIAKKYGCSDSVVRKAIKKYNIPFCRRKYNFNSDELKKLYYEDKLSIAKIAEKLGCTDLVVRIRLKELGRKAEKRSNRIEIDEELLKKYIEIDGLTYEETAKKMGLKFNTVANRARKLGLKKPLSRINQASYDELYDLFIVQGKTHKEIANEYGCTIGYLRHVLSKLGIVDTMRKKVIISDEELKRLYVDENISIRNIYNKTGMSERAIKEALKRMNIDTSGKWGWITKELLIELYVNQNMNVPEITEKLGCNKGIISTKISKWALNDMRTPEKHRESVNRSLSKTSTRSKGEDEILELYPTTFLNDYTVLGWELDLWYPEKSVAIEYNGDYWHSVKVGKPGKHIAKTTLCESRKIHLINIFERFWRNKEYRPKIINILDNNLNREELKVPEGTVKRVKKDEAQEFIRTNNIENVVSAQFHVGTYNEYGELINLLSFNRDKFSVKIKRFTTKIGYIEDYADLIGYIEEYFSPAYMEVLCDRRYYDGSIFQKDGFEIVDITNADYEYVYDLKSVSRITYKKNPLKYKDYNKVYDCGKIKLKLAL